MFRLFIPIKSMKFLACCLPNSDEGERLTVRRGGGDRWMVGLNKPFVLEIVRLFTKIFHYRAE